jgi:hypothetical protein
MKAPWMVRLAVLMGVGLLVSQAGAAVMTMQLELASGQTPVVSASSPTVAFNVYAYIAGTDGLTTNDGVAQFYGALKSAGTLSGNLSFTLDPAFTIGNGFSSGTVQDLDGDGDLDVGGTAPNTQAVPTNAWIYGTNGSGTFAALDGNRVLVGTGVFTATTFAPGTEADLNWSYRLKTTAPSAIDGYKVDGTSVLVAGSSANLGVGPALVITPEPATMAILGLGAMVNLFIRRKRSA